MGVGNPEKQLQKVLRSVWGKWDIQTIILGSLLFQTILVLLGPMRKNRKSAMTLLLIWVIYLTAENVASFAIGLINSGDPSQIAAFWAAFLLLHLGGPHTITSFAIEDNDLWHRHLLSLVVQVFLVLLVFYRSRIYLSHDLRVPTLIVFVIGVVKYAERTRSLYLASQSIMRRSMRKELKPRDETPAEQETGYRDLEAGTCRDEVEIMYKGYKLYKMFRGFILDHTFIHITESKEAMEDFLKLGHEDAFKVMEVELNFMYDSMFTKMASVQWISWFGYLYRFVLHIALIVVTLIFFYRNKSTIHARDTSVTYILLGGAVLLDSIAMVKLVFSEWTVAIMKDAQEEYERLKQWPDEEDRRDPLGMFKYVKKRIGGWVLCMKRNERIIRIVNFIKNRISRKQRWSETMNQYSLLNHSLNSRWEWVDKILDYFGLIERIDSFQYTKLEPVETSLRKMVFEHIKNEAEERHRHAAENGSETAPAEDKDRQIPELRKICSILHKYEYDIRVLILHVATDICYYAIDDEEEEEDENRETCQNISEYLAYLLVVEGKITSAMPGNVGMRFRDICWEEVEHTREELTCRLASKQPSYVKYMKYMLESTWEDIKEAFTNLKNSRNKNAAGRNKKRVRTRREQHIRRWEDMKRRVGSEKLLWEVGDEEGKCIGSKSVLKEAVQLAKGLKRFSDRVPNAAAAEGDNGGRGSKEMWGFLSDMWVKLLLYAGTHCRGDVHYLNKGGEFLTFVRLMMAHSGLKQRFKDEAAAAGNQVDVQIN
ncbi:PREDICTED: uncharacterized protein LOC109169237 isoform X2 [Ipomoea nil]|uniref:uncharacterized protein LOC109169237 isoform X2 n=1 Tax=Ipomoea nil TaxID=35883 RepID=UPI000900C36B|nr:PREDICTED: uncharacterized protein LOC109169237 isoform X2 [Ipomoea nil]